MHTATNTDFGKQKLNRIKKCIVILFTVHFLYYNTAPKTSIPILSL